MARRPVTSTAERRPNKERSRLWRKSWQCDFDVQAVLDWLMWKPAPVVNLYCVHRGKWGLTGVRWSKHCWHIKCKFLYCAVSLWACHTKCTQGLGTPECIPEMARSLEFNQLSLNWGLIQQGYRFLSKGGEFSTWADCERIMYKRNDILGHAVVFKSCGEVVWSLCLSFFSVLTCISLPDDKSKSSFQVFPPYPPLFSLFLVTADLTCISYRIHYVIVTEFIMY